MVEPDANDDSKLIISKVSKAEASAAAVAYTAAPVAQMPVIPAAPIPVAPVVQQAAQPVAPAPVQQAQQPMPSQLPPWMQQPAQPTAAPQGNLPPWMQQK